jgi:PAT family beta-lactamase induction signal transducer AmpG
MALTRWATGTLSGWVWPMVGERYDLFFTVALLASIPPVLLAWRAPFPQRSSDEASP